MCMSYTKSQKSLGFLRWPTEEIAIVPVKDFCGLGMLHCCIYRDTHQHTELISLISLSGSAVTPSCLGQTSAVYLRSDPWEWWLSASVWTGPLTSLLRTTTPPLSSTVTVSLSLSLSFAISIPNLRSALNLSLSLSVDISTGGFLFLVLFTPPRHRFPLVRLNTYLQYSAPT